MNTSSKQPLREQFVIRGGKKLSGFIDVRGSKNATTPILAASLLTKEPCVIENLPKISDVMAMLGMLEEMGASVKWEGERRVRIHAQDIHPEALNRESACSMRSSILFLGSLSGRCEKFTLPHPGGCVIGSRPVGTHFDALRSLGVKVRISRDAKSYFIDARNKQSGHVVLREFSVTATENAMMLASALPQTTVIKIAAAEPHVEDLGRFLIGMGVKIEGLGTHTLTIRGKHWKELHGVEHSVISDANEAATFLILGAATRSDIEVRGAREEHLDLVLERLRQFGAKIIPSKEGIRVCPGTALKAVGKLDARIYPGIPTDVQAPFGVLATQSDGETIIHDTLFEGRFNYIGELQKMGANAHILNPHQALIVGKTPLRGTSIDSFDLRAGAALIIAALCASGTTVIRDAYQVDRGYENIEERLRTLGASIERRKVEME